MQVQAVSDRVVAVIVGPSAYIVLAAPNCRQTAPSSALSSGPRRERTQASERESPDGAGGKPSSVRRSNAEAP